MRESYWLHGSFRWRDCVQLITNSSRQKLLKKRGGGGGSCNYDRLLVAFGISQGNSVKIIVQHS
jgi:hypothetical protein